MSHSTLAWRHLAAASTISLLAACAQTPVVASNPAPRAAATWYHVDFGTSSHVIDATGEQTIAGVTNFLQLNPHAVATIIGKTDTVGSVDYNMHLSHQRADAVRDALVYHSNVAAERIETRWIGQNRQDVATAGDVPAKENRVVDITIQ
jgi:outer membrane protein OmpA-like peptidoglycan-associated protein